MQCACTTPRVKNEPMVVRELSHKAAKSSTAIIAALRAGKLGFGFSGGGGWPSAAMLPVLVAPAAILVLCLHARPPPLSHLSCNPSSPGFLLPYFCGVVQELQAIGLLRPGITQLAGSSAGSLMAACVTAGVSAQTVGLGLHMC